jgi:catechol 2,3-dioxygenase-like lactoylglutathione lyase family enzyme
MLRLKALHHVGLVVSDMDRSLRFYCDGIGLELLRRSERAAVLGVGGQEINVFPQRGVPSAGGHEGPHVIDHFCLEVQAGSIDELIASLKSAGIAVTKGPEKRSDGMSLFVSDPDGCRVELLLKT